MSNLLGQDWGSDSEDDDFNPAQEVGSDNEGGSKPSKTANGRKGSDAPAADEESDDGTSAPKPRFGLGDDEDDEEDAEGKGVDLDGEEDDEEDDDEDEEEDDDRPRKRHKRIRRNQFIDVEAEVDDEDEEDELEDDEVADELHPDDAALDLPAGTENDDRRHRELDRQRDLAVQEDAEKQAAALKERYGRNKAYHQSEVSALPQHLLLPSVNDPPIYACKVKIGKETEVVNTIMKRFAERMNSREPLRIISVFSRPDTAMSGYIYVEARTQQDVLGATEDVPNCYSRNSIQMLNITERPDLLRVTPPKQVEPGMWVRLKRPPIYAGDLAQVEEVEDNGSNVTLKIIPRIDYAVDDDQTAPQGAVKRKRPTALTRPPARLFNEQKARQMGGGRYLNTTAALTGKQFQFKSDTYIQGFLIKDFKLRDISMENVNPTLEEVAKFAASDEDGRELLDLEAISASLKATQSSDYVAGDKVEIYKGEQTGVKGKAIAVRADIVTIEVIDGPLKGQRVDAPIKSLRKLFREGDHVKVTGASKYQDEVGMVVRVKDDRVTFATDSNQDEITVFSKDLRLSGEAGAAPISSRYGLHDLVQLDATTVACVIKIDKESLRVLDQNGQVKTMLPSNISNRLERRKNAVATDREGSEIRVDDTVKEWMGSQRQGHVMHVHRNFLFIQNRTQVENAGIFVTTSQNVQTVAAKGGRINNVGPDLTKMNPVLQQRNGANGTPVMPPPKTVGRDRLIGKTVTIAKGPYKGLLGIVKDATDLKARVEIHSKNKQLNIEKEFLRVKDPVTGQSVSLGRGRGAPMGAGPPGFGGMGRTPMAVGSRVPGAVARTPAAADAWSGSRTPAGAGGGRTPAWGRSQDGAPGWRPDDGGRTSYANDGSRTSYGNDGSRSSHGNDGSRTSYGGRTEYGGAAWSASARTPYTAGSGFSGGRDDYASGSKTPMGVWGSSGSGAANASGSRTPAYTSNGGAYNAPTPGAGYGGAPTPYNSAPTPGAYAAPTPGAMDGPTPRPYGDYRTPAASAPTPGAGYPETPGAFPPETPAASHWEDDGPRYED